jgi:methylated-DNA-[protein]-cysteine S-methyltransferase
MKSNKKISRLAKTLMEMCMHQTIPASTRRELIRTRLLEQYAGIRLAVFQTRLGWVGLAWTTRGIIALNLPRATRAHALRDLQRAFPLATVVNAPPAIVRELREYAQGHRHRFDLPLDWSSLKPFQRAVLETAKQIPFGETRSYGWIAEQIGKPRAARAVGQALRSNPIPIILPCHRVVRGDGGLGGYAGGIALKRKLLTLEGAMLAS